MTTLENQGRFLKKIAGAAAGAVFALLGAGVQATPVNLALATNGSVATQSSNHPGLGLEGSPGTASRAIDGNTSTNWYSGSMTHTAYESRPWWEVKLGGGSAAISQIDVWNRTDCCTERLDHFNVTILNAGSVVWQSLDNSYLAATPHALFSMSSVIGDTVRISLNTTNYLSLAEVQVWGTAAVASAVPEPGALGLLAMGLGALGVSRRARGRREHATA